ncbi:MAG TPA: hypothetical protein VFJ14_01755 [Nocardioidaceae bacterium]|nr:hypothetical protein [Nocardioidaceae bacterium]
MPVQLAASVVLDALAHYRQHADAYEPIVAALRDLPASAVYDPGTNTCRLCDWIDGEHTDLCPWWLAQQTEGGEA